MVPKADIVRRNNKGSASAPSEVALQAAGQVEVQNKHSEQRTAIIALIVSGVVGLSGHVSTFATTWIVEEKKANPAIVCHVEIREAVKLQQEIGVILPYSGEIEDKCHINAMLAIAPTAPRS